MCRAPADLDQIQKLGYIREGYQADLVLISPEDWTLQPADIRSKCGWSPLERTHFAWKVKKTFVNGNEVYSNGIINACYHGQELRFR